MHGVRGDIEGTMRLPTVLDLAAAEGFLAAVLQQVQADKALRLDASGVETLTLPCVQIILSAARNYDVTVSAPSNAFSSAFKDLGLDCPYDPEHVKGQGPGQEPDQVQAQDQVEGPLEEQVQARDQADGPLEDAIQAPDQVDDPAQDPVEVPVQAQVQAQVEVQVEDQVQDPVQVLDQAPASSPGPDEVPGQAQTPTDEASMTKRILTIDDSRTIRDMLMLTLTDAGYDVLQGVDGQDGIDVLGNQHVDVVITDINMPKMDGYEVIRQLRRSPVHKVTPILVLTTESDKDKKMLARDAGATGWMVKPFDPENLIATIGKVCP
jgi:two-component system chemotaxis response regulator CheY